MARGNRYDKSYADRYMRKKQIERVGPLLDQMIIDDISPLKLMKMEFDIANPTVRKLRNMNPSVSHNTLNKFCYIIGYYLHQETVAEEKYGRCDGKLQEQEGPIIAQKMLSQLGFENYIVERICFLIGHHHTYDNIDGLDYQILVEADFLVNLYEDDAGNRAIDKAYKRIFKTETGKKIFRLMFGYEEED